jgi:hypothetical protein
MPIGIVGPLQFLGEERAFNPEKMHKFTAVIKHHNSIVYSIPIEKFLMIYHFSKEFKEIIDNGTEIKSQRREVFINRHKQSLVQAAKGIGMLKMENKYKHKYLSDEIGKVSAGEEALRGKFRGTFKMDLKPEPESLAKKKSDIRKLRGCVKAATRPGRRLARINMLRFRKIVMKG